MVIILLLIDITIKMKMIMVVIRARWQELVLQAVASLLMQGDHRCVSTLLANMYPYSHVGAHRHMYTGLYAHTLAYIGLYSHNIRADSEVLSSNRNDLESIPGYLSDLAEQVAKIAKHKNMKR